MRMSDVIKQTAAKLGVPVVDIKMSDPYAALYPIAAEAHKGTVIENVAAGDVVVGDMVLMEYADGVLEHVKVEAIDDGMVYATGEDGEDFCAPLTSCDKVPC